jgi:hypothetical protein
MNETRLVEKLKLIEALCSGATTEGEKEVAGNALATCRALSFAGAR